MFAAAAVSLLSFVAVDVLEVGGAVAAVIVVLRTIFWLRAALRR